MKLTTLTLAIVLIGMTATSCSIFNGRTRTPSPSQTEAGQTADGKSVQKSSVGTDALAGEWQITAVGENKIVPGDEAPYVNFDASTGNFYGFNGCNVINGSFQIKGKTISFGNVISTMKYCADAQFDSQINSVLSDGQMFTPEIKRIGQETYLYLNSAKGSTAMTLRKHNMEFLNGNWQVTSIDGKPVNDDEANVFFDIRELKIHGNTGCNFFNGVIYIDPNRSNAIDFSNMGMTRMACPKSEQEQAMMLSLEETASAISGNNGNTALLLDQKGREVMTLKRIANNPE